MRTLGAGAAELGSKIWPSDSRPQRLQTIQILLQKSAIAVEEREIHCEAAWFNEGHADYRSGLGLQGYGEVKREGRRENGLSKVRGWERTGGFRPGQGAGAGQGGVSLEGASKTVVPRGGLGFQAGGGERTAWGARKLLWRQYAEPTGGGKGRDQ